VATFVLKVYELASLKAARFIGRFVRFIGVVRAVYWTFRAFYWRCTCVLLNGLVGWCQVRCSSGLSVASYSGSFTKHTSTDLDLPAIDCNKAIVAYLRHDDKLATDGLEACAINQPYVFIFVWDSTQFHTVAYSSVRGLARMYRIREGGVVNASRWLVGYRRACSARCCSQR
jgi:hypothetical protein